MSNIIDKIREASLATFVYGGLEFQLVPVNGRDIMRFTNQFLTVIPHEDTIAQIAAAALEREGGMSEEERTAWAEKEALELFRAMSPEQAAQHQQVMEATACAGVRAVREVGESEWASVELVMNEPEEYEKGRSGLQRLWVGRLGPNCVGALWAEIQNRGQEGAAERIGNFRKQSGAGAARGRNRKAKRKARA